MIFRHGFLALLAPALIFAAVVGTNPPSLPLTAERIAALPAAEQPAWRAYLDRSNRQRKTDQAFLAAELKAANLKEALVPGETRGFGNGSLNRPAEWYASADARRMADNVVTFQTPAGGWSKNFNPADHPRRPGEGFSHDNTSRFLSAGDNDAPADPHWTYIGTFDNDATITELQFLAKVAAATDAKTGATWRASVQRGLDYIFAAQYPNGGFPQVYPLDGGYHDGITFNDGAFVNILTVLRSVADGKEAYAWLATEQRERARASVARGIACLLKCQIMVNGQPTAWCQQYDMLTFAPSSARNYEMPSKSGGESAGIALFLMSLPDRTPEIVRAVDGVVAWFQKTAIRDVAFRPSPDGTGRKLQAAPGNGPIWARYYDIATDRPIFGDRDKSIHDNVNEISQERRNGYSWFGDGPKRALERYAQWKK
jgi:PelA/Pel-15E family pectate lyase